MSAPQPAVPWRRIACPEQVADAIIDLYRQMGQRTYDEAITQTSHAAQCAVLAMKSGAASTTIVAALLHDIGHLLEPDDSTIRHEEDLRHEYLGARFLSNWYPTAVTEPIRHHVAAKRYLCAVEPAYFDGLSPASQHSLSLQGGPFSPNEVAEFESHEEYETAVLLRRWDDEAKDPRLHYDHIDDYRDLLTATVLPLPRRG